MEVGPSNTQTVRRETTWLAEYWGSPGFDGMFDMQQILSVRSKVALVARLSVQETSHKLLALVQLRRHRSYGGLLRRDFRERNVALGEVHYKVVMMDQVRTHDRCVYLRDREGPGLAKRRGNRLTAAPVSIRNGAPEQWSVR
ncbi:hypothetical protein M514_11448 [Trichuris suis]|uniref:Uncharacterized protein n=1 Tax=Trichuris suis TaxID=68888 RepID=A0A085NGW3_9BILA|nr:hypothetical protein M514_11448 [Trichuris suis]